jgi:hypothetical protein
MHLFNRPSSSSTPKPKAPQCWLLALALAATGLTTNEAAAQRWDFPQAHPVGEHPNVTTQIVLRSVIGIYEAPPSPAVVAVPTAAKVTFALPLDDNEIASVTWFKDGEPLAASTKTLALDKVAPADSGVYTATVQRTVENPVPFASIFERIELQVGENKPQKLINISTRATIDASNRSLIAGFVVDGDELRPDRSTLLLIRGVGPTLADHGVPAPLASPKVELFAANGAKIAWPEVYIPEWNPYYLARLVAPYVGAAPLRPDDKDFAILYALPSGSYTLHVSSADGGAGDVVLEVYEVPASAVPDDEVVIFPAGVTRN